MLRCLDTSKAVGVDMVTAKLLKMAAEGISRSLTSLDGFLWTDSSGMEGSECNSCA